MCDILGGTVIFGVVISLFERSYFVAGQVVTAWINTCPQTATWTNLVEALTEVGRRKTAQEVAEKRGKALWS